MMKMKKVLFYAFLLPAFVGMMFSCSDVKTDVKKLEGKWNVVEVKGEKVLEEGLPQMDFNMAEKKLHGNTGCNLFNTTITLDSEDVSSITIAPGATTMMACPNMDLETSVLQSMDQVRSVKAGKDENEMLLVDQDGNVFEMEDLDGDGWIDTPVSSEVVIEPEEDLDWETGNEEWMEETRPGGIDYEDPDGEEDNNNNDDNEGAQESGIKDPNKEQDQRPKDEEEFKRKLSEIAPILNKLGINLDEYKIQLNKETCLTNARTLPDNTIEVCTQFFNYTTNEQASIIWHEIYHINHEHNQAPITSDSRIELPTPPENVLNGINAYIEWLNRDITSELMDIVKEDYLKNLLIEENAKNIQWYENELETYAAEKNNGIPKSDYYEGLIDFMQWRCNQIISHLNK